MAIQASEIFKISSEDEFNRLSLEIFNFQYQNCEIYRKWVECITPNISHIKHYSQIPFLPIQFFKSHKVFDEKKEIQQIFKSSGTTESVNANHYLTDLSIYQESFLKGFQLAFGELEQYHILALLPSYLEREGSSLVYMMEHLINKTNDPDSGFYLHDFEALNHQMLKLKTSAKKTMLWGVSYALLDFCDQFPSSFPELLIIETGGMKGKRSEMIRQELHEMLCNGFGVKTIGSEYGMTELLSQAYYKKDGLFQCPPWMKVLIRDVYDPLSFCKEGRNGGINVIDLANINSCS